MYLILLLIFMSFKICYYTLHRYAMGPCYYILHGYSMGPWVLLHLTQVLYGTVSVITPYTGTLWDPESYDT